MLLLLALLSYLPARADSYSCTETTWELRSKAPNKSDLSPGLDRQSAAYQCSVTSLRGHTRLYLSSVETLTQLDNGYCLPWGMASYLTFVLLDRAYYLGLSTERELRTHKGCIDWLRSNFASTAAPASYTCFRAVLSDNLPALRSCLSGKESHDPIVGGAAVYACHGALFGAQEGCGSHCMQGSYEKRASLFWR